MTWPNLYRIVTVCFILLNVNATQAATPKNLSVFDCLPKDKKEGFLGLGPDPARICPCSPANAPSAEFTQSDAIFVGTVTNSVYLEPQSNVHKLVGFYYKFVPPLPRLDYLQLGSQTTTFKVETAWKGVTTTRVTLLTSTVGECGFQFSQGKKYLVYSHREGDGNLWASACSRTASAETADVMEDFNYLQQVPKIELSPAVPLQIIFCVLPATIVMLMLLGLIWQIRRKAEREHTGP